MKTLTVSLLGLIISLNTYSQAAKDALKLYGIKSGIIQYKHSGSSTGTSTLYFDNYGHKSANYSDITYKGSSTPKKGWVVSFDEMQYMYAPGNKNGQKLKNPMVEGLKKVKDMDKFTEETYSKMGFKPAGTEKYLEKDCKVYKGKMGKVLTWNGILMYMEMNIAGTTTKQEVTKIDVNVPVKASLFELPKDVKFTELQMHGM